MSYSSNYYFSRKKHVMNKPEGKVMRRLMSQTGMSEKEIRAIKKYRVILSEAQKSASESIWSDVDRATEKMLKKITKKLKLPKEHPEVRKRFQKVWDEYWRLNSEKILNHYDSTIGENRVLLTEKSEVIIIEGVNARANFRDRENGRTRIYNWHLYE